MYKDHIVIDGLQYCKWDRDYFETLKKSGITAVHITLVYHELARETLQRFGQWHRYFEENKDLIIPITNIEDIETAKKEGKVGVFFGAQNSSPIEDDFSLVKIMRKLGLLIMQLTYNNQSLLATGCYEKEDTGITRFGRQVIREMNKVGMVIDMSHSAERSTLEAIDISERSICISHANPDFACESLRNKSMNVIKRLVKSGGLLGFSVYPFHLPNHDKCTLQQFCQMIAKTAEEVGTDHLGIGSDWCLHQPHSVLEWMRNGRWSKETDYGEGSAKNAQWPAPLPWFKDEKGMHNVFDGLLEVGFDESEVGKIMGGNWYRFLKEATVPVD